MQTKSPGWQAIVQSNAVTLEFQVNLSDPDGVLLKTYTGQMLSSVDVSRSLTTDAPSGTRFSGGYAAADATIIVQGIDADGDSVFDYFNPWNATSPLNWHQINRYRITVDTVVPGTTDPITRIFTGWVDQVTTDVTDTQVTIVAIDGRRRLGVPAVLPPVANFPNANIGGWYYAPGLTSLYAVGYMLFQKGIYSAPLPRILAISNNAGAMQLLYASFHGSAWPEQGTPGATMQSPDLPGYIIGKWSNQVVEKNYLIGILGAANTVTPDYTRWQYTGIEWWQKCYGPDLPPDAYDTFVSMGMYGVHDPDGSPMYSGITVYTLFDPSVNGGNVYLEIQMSARDQNGNTLSTQTINVFTNIDPDTDENWHQFTLFYYPDPAPAGGGGGITFYFTVYVDGVVSGGINYYSMQFTNAQYPTWGPYMQFQISERGVESLQVTTKDQPYVNSSQPDVILDASLNAPMVAMPDVGTDDMWTTLQKIASAENAAFGFDELGVPFFTNRHTLAVGADIARDVDATASLISLEGTSAADNAVREVDVPVNVVAAGALATVWAAGSAIRVPAYGSTTINATLAQPTVGLLTDAVGIPNGPTIAATGYRACTTADGTGNEVGIGVIDFEVVQTTPTKAVITLTNPTIHDVYMVSPSAGYTDVAPGTPTMFLAGQPITAVNTSVVGTGGALGSSVSSRWPEQDPPGADVIAALALAANDWLQDQGVAQLLADDMIENLYNPKMQLDNIVIMPDPSLQLNDVVRLLSTGRRVVDDLGRIYSIHHTFTSDTATTTLGVELIASLGTWILGVPGRTELGETTYV